MHACMHMCHTSACMLKQIVLHLCLTRENLLHIQLKWIQNRCKLNPKWGNQTSDGRLMDRGQSLDIFLHMKRGFILEDRWKAEIDQGPGEPLSLQTCQGSSSSSWSQDTGRAETLNAKPACLCGVSPRCPSPAKILVVVVYAECSCHANWICQGEGWATDEVQASDMRWKN